MKELPNYTRAELSGFLLQVVSLSRSDPRSVMEYDEVRHLPLFDYCNKLNLHLIALFVMSCYRDESLREACRSPSGHYPHEGTLKRYSPQYRELHAEDSDDDSLHMRYLHSVRVRWHRASDLLTHLYLLHRYYAIQKRATDWFVDRVTSHLANATGAGHSLMPEWVSSDASALAKHILEWDDQSALPILADSLQDNGCDNEDMLSHMRSFGAMCPWSWIVRQCAGHQLLTEHMVLASVAE